jgi:hypothetical protein
LRKGQWWVKTWTGTLRPDHKFLAAFHFKHKNPRNKLDSWAKLRKSFLHSARLLLFCKSAVNAKKNRGLFGGLTAHTRQLLKTSKRQHPPWIQTHVTHGNTDC